ncbi:hypothetical protein EMMF5_002223 [Cystobasidiomycetes sp. EMM_F5]
MALCATTEEDTQTETKVPELIPAFVVKEMVNGSLSIKIAHRFRVPRWQILQRLPMVRSATPSDQLCGTSQIGVFSLILLDNLNSLESLFGAHRHRIRIEALRDELDRLTNNVPPDVENSQALRAEARLHREHINARFEDLAAYPVSDSANLVYEAAYQASQRIQRSTMSPQNPAEIGAVAPTSLRRFGSGDTYPTSRSRPSAGHNTVNRQQAGGRRPAATSSSDSRVEAAWRRYQALRNGDASGGLCMTSQELALLGDRDGLNVVCDADM